MNKKVLGRPGVLTLIPTPISPDEKEISFLEPVALDLLLEASLPENLPHSIFVHEEPKVARRRWISWGLPREAIDTFIYCNEQNFQQTSLDIIGHLKNKKRVFLMSDSGLPAFCDPGQYLVSLCHNKAIPVTATPFPHSVALAIALSGFSFNEYHFHGFLPHKGQQQDMRKKAIKDILTNPLMSVLMDTPYRLLRLLEEFNEVETEMLLERKGKNRELFLALDLQGESELLLRGSVKGLLTTIRQEPEVKREFVLVVGPKI